LEIVMAAIADPNGTDLQTAPGRSRLLAAAGALLPGLSLAAGVSVAAYGLRLAPGLGAFSPMILAIVLGVAFGNLIGAPAIAKAGVTFAMRRVLRIAIVLLGLQLTIAQVGEVGVGGVAAIALTLVATFLFTTWLGRLMGVDRKLAQLIAGGTSICGASAVVAVNTVTRGSDEDVAYAVACVTVFGTIAMVAYPWLPGLLRLDAHAFGLWSGASIHEIAQVVAASFADGQAAGEFGTVAKLTRVMMLAPVVLTLGMMAARGRDSEGRTRAAVPTPWFVLGFVALVGINSLFSIPAEAKAAIGTVTTFLLTVALAAMGLETNVAKLRAKGLRPLLLGLASFLFIACFSLALVKLCA
jgi:uncharacterized integral membrane protein (TIGR00698 family)